MPADGPAYELLQEVTAAWAAEGPLRVLQDLAKQVWRTDVDRFEPGLGDDATSLGIQASRNLCNLAVRALGEQAGTVARGGKTLEVQFGGRTLHTGKAPSQSPTWDIWSIDWSDSDVRDDAARANSAAYQPTEGTLLEYLPPVPGQGVEQDALRYLHLMWQGFEDGTSRAWLGFPSLGREPWFAVQPLESSGGGSGGLSSDISPAPSTPPPPSFDALGEPPVPVTRRAQPAAQVDQQVPGA